MEEGDKSVGLIESPMQYWGYPGVQLVLESFYPKPSSKEDSEAQEYLQCHLGQQKASRVDQLGLIGLV